MVMDQKRAYWAGVIEQQAGSGQSIKHWCVTHGINEGKYYAWKARLRAKPSEPSGTGDGFIPLVLPGAGTLSVDFGRDIRVEVNGACSLDHLRATLEVLRGSRKCWR